MFNNKENKFRVTKEKKLANRKVELIKLDQHNNKKRDLSANSNSDRENHQETGSVGELSNQGLSSMLANLKKGNCKRPSMRREYVASPIKSVAANDGEKEVETKDEKQNGLGKLGFKMPMDFGGVKLRSVGDKRK